MKPTKAIVYNPVCDPKSVHQYRNVRWIENASRGLRLVGFADEILPRSIQHKGWFTMDDGDNGEVYRGVVYQLPARNGETRYVYGYADPNNDDCALLSFDLVSDKAEAAKYADRFAEIFAEYERDYNRAWDAGRRHEALANEIKETRVQVLAIGAEMRAAKRANVQAPTICATLRAQVLSLYRSIQKMRKEREELFNDFGSQPGFVE